MEKFYSSTFKMGIKVNLSTHDTFDGKQYEANAYFLHKYLEKNKFKRIITTNSFIAKEILPQLSIEFKSQAVTDIISIEDDVTFLRPIYAGNAIAKV